MGTAKVVDRVAEEAKTWCIPQPGLRQEKVQRERIRHPKLIKDLLLDQLSTHTMDVLEIGGGPIPLSDLLDFQSRLVIDPCADHYREYFPCRDHINDTAEHWYTDDEEERFDLVICTNALDHVQEDMVPAVIDVIRRVLRPGGFTAIMCAENNALTNPHPCHGVNLTASDVHRMMDDAFETCWELTYAKDGYRYGWAAYEGKIGQPAFALLMRKAVGY